jgi:glucose dehydrogenase
VDTTTPRTTAYLLVAGLVLSTVGTLLAGDEATASTWTGGVLLLAGFVSVVAGLIRWALRSRGSAPAEVRRTPAAV